MSDGETAEEKPFAVDRAKTARAKCKKCKCPIDKDQIRIAKVVPSPFGEGKMKSWHHVTCIFEVFAKQRATTKKIDNPEDDIEGWEKLSSEDKKTIQQKLEDFENSAPYKAAKEKANAKKTPKKPPKNKKTSDIDDKPADDVKNQPGPSPDKAPTQIKTTPKGKIAKNAEPTKDDLFREFRRLCCQIADASAYLDKTAIVKKRFTKGASGDGFKSDVVLWCRLLLPGVVKRIYNLQSKALIKLFSRLLVQGEEEMLEDLEKGDVAETVKTFYESSAVLQPSKVSVLTLQEVDAFLDELSKLTKEEEQINHFRSIIKRCTSNDLKMIIRLIKHDLRINAGPKHILGAIHEDAYEAFQLSRDLPAVIGRCLGISPTSSPSSVSTTSTSMSPTKKKSLALMTPVLPMLAQACTSVQMAMQKCPNGMLSEVKYDGERVQIHKNGDDFRYYSRSLKPVLEHKVKLLKEYIPQAFPGGGSLILDTEILMIDTTTGKPLPFGSLGKHKRDEFAHANVCLFVFDCIFYNGDVLLDRTMKERRTILTQKMVEIPNRVLLSEVQEIQEEADLANMIAKVLKLGLEGLVLKGIDGKYEPGKRHWLKVKKDYLFKGAMADTADLVVLGAWYGTGNKGGMMSVFLMGCYDPERKIWLTVTKVHTGHDDATLARLQDELDMVKIGKDPDLVPSWLRANKPMIPDFVAKDPLNQPVWEITGAEFTNQGVHTAEGISIRFPRVTRIRDDKDWKTATNLHELRALFNKSADSIDFSLLLGNSNKKTTLDDFVEKKRPKRESEPSTSKDFDDAGIAKRSDKPRTPAKTKKNIKAEVADRKIKIESYDDEFMDTKNIKKEISDDDEMFSKTVPRETNSLKRTSLENSDASKPKKNLSSTRKIKKEIKMEYQNSSDSAEDEKGSEKGEFFAFVGQDYIEYTKDGKPLNWIDGKKPPDGLPKNAKPISTLSETKKASECVLNNVRVRFSSDFKKERRKIARRTLKTLGAKILGKSELRSTTHVIHGKKNIPASILQESTGIPKTARHVHESWIEHTAAKHKLQADVNYAVSLSNDYCTCSCNK